MPKEQPKKWQKDKKTKNKPKKPPKTTLLNSFSFIYRAQFPTVLPVVGLKDLTWDLTPRGPSGNPFGAVGSLLCERRPPPGGVGGNASMCEGSAQSVRDFEMSSTV